MLEEDQYFETGSEVEESFDTQPQEDDQAPQQNPTDNSDTPSKSLYSAPRSFFGGNFDVYSALETVVFQKAAGDASLRGNVAYIRVWKRGGTAQQTQSSASAPSILEGQDEQKRLEDDLEAAIGNRDNVANNYDPRIGEYDYNPYGDDVDNPIEVAEANIQIAENALQRQQALRAQTPTSTPLDPNNTNTRPLPPPLPPLPKTDGAVGAVKSANPNGAINLFAKAGRAIVGIPQGKPEYSGGANTGSTLVGSATPPSGEMMWQFLFNPSELEIEAGPEFKNAETWGVSDKGNSGQPLHWSHNKNAQLKFNSILLNGYVFGRKVEKLEQGLIELFMARDGEGQHGPHVLEFVWGKRVFGPCVIKNVNIKEKMWDEGEVVNAEVSFTLEQVPEWTINDGFVDVARPGRLDLTADPTATNTTASTPTTSTTSTTPTTAPTPAPKEKATDPKSAEKEDPDTKGDGYRTCKKAQEFIKIFNDVEQHGEKIVKGQLQPIAYNQVPNRLAVTGYYVKFAQAYSQANSSIGTDFISRVPPQQKPPLVKESLDAMKVARVDFYKQTDVIRNAALRSKAAAENVWESPGCKKLIAKAAEDKVSAKNANNKEALCKGIVAGKPCNAGAGSFSKNPCTGKTLLCDGKGKYQST